MAKVLKTIVPASDTAKPIDKAVAIKAAQNEACPLIVEMSDLDNRKAGVGAKLTNVLIVLFRLTEPGSERDMAMRPLYDAVIAARSNGDKSYGEKEARQYLYNYVTNARKAIEAGLQADSGENLSIRKVNAAAKERAGDKGATKVKRRGRQPKADLDKVMDYARPMLANLKELASPEGAYSQAVQLMMWIAHECKYDAVHNGQHKTLVITIK